MLKIKLVRVGKKKQPSYRIVVANDRAKLNGRYIDIIGIYDPLTQPHTIKIEKEKYLSWLEKGAQPTPGVRRLLEKLL